MIDLIDRQYAIATAISGRTREIDGERWIRTSEVRESLKRCPTVQPERCEDCGNFNKARLLIPQPERKKGRWVNKKPRWIATLSMTVHDAYECSECGEPGVSWWKYCVNCGAQMEIEEWRKPILERWRSENERSD